MPPNVSPTKNTNVLKPFAQCVLKIKTLRKKIRKVFLFLENLLHLKNACSRFVYSKLKDLLHARKAFAKKPKAFTLALVWDTPAPLAGYLWQICTLYIWVISLFSPLSTPTRGVPFDSTAAAVMGQVCPTRLRLELKNERIIFH